MRAIFETTLNLLTAEVKGVYYRRHAALELPEALGVATQLCATNPARLLGESDRGSLRKGSRADAVLAEITGAPGEQRVRVERVWLAGG
jgi:alpha-D-ribose 1-methylphosphonate 5-triphosphate diphosphatase PhnM